jgi:formate-dependent nitrite reductase cytochrome c552 subunit
MLRSTVTGFPADLPDGHEAAATGITCEVCHDSHKPNVDGGFGLRNPSKSTEFFSYNTAANTTFAAQYDENVQLCGQCHNQRGASPDDTSRPPHHSPQYNMLIGDIGVAKGYVAKSIQVEHTKLENQCAYCHMHQESPANPTPDNPADTGHKFEPNKNACIDCHETVENAQFRIVTTQADTKKRIAEVKALLDKWAQTKAPAALQKKYGALAWEYTSPGVLSNPSGAATIVGPSTAEQAQVSSDIKKARMYLYMVEHDGSFGVHNGQYARYLLGTAKTNVLNQLNAP